ncbi:hypothetical protein BGAL_0201g00040 [Botrytis galanthina]|uniref:Uncharacterized protein n=1 Tax=Botrytis galanthina TaxID=278940 RepID=A0A4S8R027_9HELO|nr:hypothetical protein BGAL_0201g00040 [Botrytis galanthina]
MLDYSALNFFRTKHVGLTPVYPELFDYMQNDFEGAEYQPNMLSQCDSITLYSSRNKVFMAREEVEASNMTCFDSKKDVPGLINQLSSPQTRERDRIKTRKEQYFLFAGDSATMAMANHTPGTTFVTNHGNTLYRLEANMLNLQERGAFNKRYNYWIIENKGEATNADSNSDDERSNLFAGFDIEDTVDDGFSKSSGLQNRA